MESYKQEKIIIIMYEYLNDKREFYPISNVPLDKAKFFYKDDDGLFKLMAVSDYTVKTELNENRLYIVNAAIKDNSEKFQIGYEINFKAAEYESPLPVLSVLTKMYNQLIEDTRILHSYIRKQCFVADGKEQALVLPNLPSYTVWCMGENGKMFALPVSELYERFGKLIKAMEKVLDEYIEQKKEEIRGPAGAIDNVTASVNSNAGTPKVTVSLGGTPERRKIDLKFENLKGDKPIKGTDYYTEQEKEQFTTETLSLVTAEGAKQVKAVTDKGAEEVSKVTTEGNKQISLTQAEALKVIEQLKKLVEGNPETSNAQTLSGKTRIEFEQDTEKVREELEEKANDNIILINKFDINSLKIGYFSGTGEIVTQEGITTNYSERYIPIKNGTKYVWTKEFYIIGSGIDSQQIVIATYDINKKFLERVFINKLDTNTKTFNSNVAFIRLSFYDCEANKKFMFCENELPKTYIPYIYYLNYDSVYGLEKNINSKIDTNNLLINDETNKKIYTFVDSIYSPNNEWDNVHEQYYGDGKFGLVSNPSYVTYALKIKKITKIYFPEPSKLYCSICIYDNHEYKNGKRYRNTDNENTLPTTTLNAVEVKEGYYILVTCAKEFKAFNMCMIDYGETLNKELPLHDNHIIQVKKEISDLMPKKWKIKYTESLNFAQARKATIDLYIPINKNYLHFEIIETYRDSETSSNPNNPTSSSNSNVWKINTASICDNKLNKKFNITANGEWECAIKLKNKEVDDFMGGDAHGDEAKESVVFIINGRPVDITTFTKLTDIDSFKFIQTSSLYKPDDKATLSTRSQFTPVATHGSEHIFTENGVIINQSVLWHEEVTVVQGYLCMMLNAKDVVDKMYTNADYRVIDLSNNNKYNLERFNVNKITQYSDSNNKGVIASVTVNRIKGMNDKGNQGYISVGDNGGGSYHKCYLPLVYSPSGEIVQKNTLWECSSKYEYEFE